MSSVPTQRLYTWCLESQLPAHLDVPAVQGAGAAFVAAGGGKVWVLDASAVGSADPAVGAEVKDVLRHLAKVGLGRVGVVLPPGIGIGLLVQAAIRAVQGTVIVRTFGSRAEAMGWLKAGCP